MSKNSKRLSVYTIREDGKGGSFWTQVGVGFVNGDGSLNVILDALPVNGKLHIREPQQREKHETDDSHEA